MGSLVPVLLVLAGLTPSPGPSVAVLRVEARQGASADSAELLSGILVDKVRRRGLFASVVGSRELDTALGQERQQALSACQVASCLGEVAGALGVSYVITGSLGRVGKAWVFNLSLVQVRTGYVRGSVSQVFLGADESHVATALEDMVDELLRDLARDTRRNAVPVPDAGLTLQVTPAQEEYSGACADAAARTDGGAMGYLSVYSEPAAPVVDVDGGVLGTTPLWHRCLPAGRHALRLLDRDHALEHPFNVEVSAGKETQRMLAVPRGKLKVVMATWAHVEVDGVKLGTTPLGALDVYAGNHVLRLHNPKLPREERVGFSVAPGQTVLVRSEW